MHLQSPALIIGGAVLKKSDDLGILVVTFNSKMTFETHLCMVSRVISQRPGILRKSYREFNDRGSLKEAFVVFPCPFSSTGLQCGARLPIRTLNWWTV